MKETNVRTRKVADSPLPNVPNPRPFLALLVALFFASGCSALIYEIVWYQLLQLVIGSSAVSLGVLLATFMGGLCIGSLALPRILSRDLHPLRVYAALELGIGICGLLALFGMPLVDRVYAAAVGHGLPAMLLRAVVSSACLLPPTILMGASLPAAARWIETGEKGVSWLGLLYGANTCGAVFGCLLAGFYLLRVYDMSTATFVAAFINAVVALISYALSKRSAAAITEAPAAMNSAKADWPVYITIALSGACALGAEIVWTRLLGLLLGATVYTFSLILAVFLIGIGIGSNAGSVLSRHIKEARIALGWCQMLIAGAIAWTAVTLAQSLPYWPINSLLSTSSWYTFQVDLVRCLWAILPAACLWGASFPLALRAVARVGEDPGRMIGGVYASNTAGAIVGALGFSLILIPHIGSRDSQRVLIAVAAISGLIVAVPVLWQRKQKPPVLAFVASSIAAIWLVTSVSPVPGELIAYGRRILTSSGRSRILYVGEGLNSSIAISQWDDGAVQFHVSGKVEASTEPYDMRLQRMLGFMPALFHPHPATVLVVGFGAGVTGGSFTRHPDVRRIVICEMEPLVPPTATRFFARENYDVMNDRRTEMIYDDARHYILTSRDRFDIITSDPIHPWVKGSATLYSKEYFELVKRHLNPGGIVTQWVPLYESDTNTVRSEIATFFAVFPRGTIWGNENAGGGYDVVLLGQAEGQKIDVPGLEQRLGSADYIGVRRALGEVGFHTPMNLLATYAGSAEDLKPWLAGAEMNRDGNLRLQYLAGMALNVSREATIYDQILRFRRYPEGLFEIPEDRRPGLKVSLGLP